LKSCCQLILDVRTSAHTVLPIDLETFRSNRLVGPTSVCDISTKRYRKPTNSEADYPSSTRPKPYLGSWIYVQLFVHRNEPNRPHISSDTINFKERGSEDPETKTSQSAFSSSGAPARQSLNFLIPVGAFRPVRFPVGASPPLW